MSLLTIGKRIGGVFFLIILPLLATLPFSFYIVDPGHVGIIKRLGALQPYSSGEGLHFKFPYIDTVVFMDIRLRHSEINASSASKDLQIVNTTVTLQYSINGNLASQLYRKIGGEEAVKKTIVDPSILESVKSVTARYTAEELITHRSKVKLGIHNEIKTFIFETLKQKGAQNSIEVANVAITNFNFSEGFNQAIELKVKAEQEALQAKNEKLRRITQAEAFSEEKIIHAKADAYKIKSASEARAGAIEREAKALKANPNLIRLRMVEKWNGQLPTMTGGGAVPMFNIDSLLDTNEDEKVLINDGKTKN